MPAVLLTLVSLMLGPGAGQAIAQSDARAILQETVAALRETQHASYDAVYRGEGALADELPVTQGHVVLAAEPEAAAFGARFRIEGTRSQPGSDVLAAFTVTFDGGQLMRRTANGVRIGNVAVDGVGVTGPLMAGGANSLALWDLVSAEPLEQEREAPLVRLEGTRSIGGVLCDLLYLQYESPLNGRTRRVRLFVGRLDRLPRRIERIAVDDGSLGGDGAYVLELQSLDVDPAPESDDHFRLQAGPDEETTRLTSDGSVPAPSLLPVGTVAPDWRLLEPGGTEHSLSEYRGRVVVLDFWATWCVPCKIAMPGIQALHERYGNRGVTFMGISVHETGDAAGFMTKQGFTYTLLLKGEQAADGYHVTTIPALYVIDREGRVAQAQIGIEKGELASLADLLEHLADPPH